jgi:hypothetical protein
LRGRHELAERWEKRLAMPVLVAALISVPAVFLTTTGGASALVGRALNWASLVLLSGEPLLLLLLSKDVTDWLWSHKWEMLLATLTVPAVIFVVGPVQILRLALSVGTLRVLRVSRILRAAREVVQRVHASVWRRRMILAAAAVVAGGFVALVVVDADSKTRRGLAWIVERIGLAPTVLSAVFAAVLLVLGIRWFGHTRLARRVRNLLRP